MDGVKEDIRSFRLSRDDAQVANNWEGKLRRQSRNTGTESDSKTGVCITVGLLLMGYLDFSFLCTFDHGSKKSPELPLHETFAPQERLFQELSFPVTFAPILKKNEESSIEQFV